MGTTELGSCIYKQRRVVEEFGIFLKNLVILRISLFFGVRYYVIGMNFYSF